MKEFKVILLIFCIIITSAVTVFLINENLNDTVVLKKYTFSHQEIPDSFSGYKIAVISDLHNAFFSDMIIDYIENEKPDIIAFTGDMVQLPYSDFDETLKIVKKFQGKILMYAVSGNHETQNPEYKNIVKTLDAEGVIWLENDSVCLEKNSDTMLLLGIRDPEHDEIDDIQAEEIRKQINSEFPDGPCFSILLSHRADLYPEIKDTRADLILSGHLHGGIIKLPFIGGLIGREENGIFPEYEYGFIKEEDSAAMIVSGGCDDNPKKKRYFNPPEILLITLESEKN